jgi:transposase-like protein
MQCIRCGSRATRRNGHTRLGGQRWRCNPCRRRFTARSASAFSRRGFFERAIAESDVTPERVITDKAGCYPPALRALLPTAEHRCSKYLNNGLERDHGHLKQRLRPMRGFKQRASADILTRGHALVQNLRNGFSSLTAPVPRALRLATAWLQLARTI